MSYDNHAVREELIAVLRRGRSVLLAGAGSSKLVGYPLWNEMLDQLQAGLTTPVLPDGDLLVRAARIKAVYEREGRLEDYRRRIESLFGPVPGPPHQFHRDLVSLGFCGITTTNYDPVLEVALRAESESYQCDELDLCDDRIYNVSKFLRGLSEGEDRRWILHLHGYYRNPSKIVLTWEDYIGRYGLPSLTRESEEVRELDDRLKELVNAGHLSDRSLKTYEGLRSQVSEPALDTIHRKVIWCLLAMHPVVFVGFSMSDPFLMPLLDLVRRDFDLLSETPHYAILSYTEPRDMDIVAERFRQYGVRSVFYYVPPRREPHEIPDHRGLQTLVAELRQILRPQTGATNLDTINEKMLRL